MIQHIDSYKHKGLRNALVQKIKENGIITSENVLAAIQQIPRHLFFESSFEQFAYQDRAFSIACNQTISQPSTVAFQSQLLDIKKHDRVLEIGTGSGYQAAVLSILGAKVFTIERYQFLKEKAEKTLNQLQYKGIRCFFGDGFNGIPSHAPFDKIIITAAAPFLPENLLKQLRINGFIVVPEGKEGSQVMKKYIKLSENELIEEQHGTFSFVPMLPNIVKL